VVARSRDVVLPIAFSTHHSKVAVGSLQWIGLEGKVNGRHTDCHFQLRSRFYAFEAILPTGIFVLDRLVSGFQTSLKSMNAGVLSASIAGQRGWSIMGTFVIWRVADFPLSLNLRLSEGTGVTQYRPSGEMGG
jgi:hypothetical protein